MSKTIQINYDLRTPGGNYDAVEQYIRGFGTWAHPLKSLWLVRTNKSGAEVRDDTIKKQQQRSVPLI